MKNITLVIMAAGIGSRFGGGIKQLAPVGPNGEIIMDYSIYDAKKAGFNKVVFVIRKDIEEEFDRIIGSRIKEIIDVEYVFQELDNIPNDYLEMFKQRTKPWGTGQAILCCKDVVKEPFLVINADDYYGKQAYQEAYEYLANDQMNTDKQQIAMVSFILKNTLSDNGGVTRGICSVNEDNHLINIVETHNIEKGDNSAFVKDGDRVIDIDLNVPVSMNMWALQPAIFNVLDEKFKIFLEKLCQDDLKAEYLLPTIIGDLLKEDLVDVTVLKSQDNWFGVTYKEDKQSVIDSIKELIMDGVYPNKLY
ncbi:nucleotidyltransferase family protein [Thomasclavelia cocleata]|jgi:UTP-glucose-1-phosphate uridylyltransferase|uniref:UTP-glucose-1-phosphate uridylyltransferase n=1 Tax=Thomasclavelia cocleata TaxID=69824 RepID=A0A1I0CHC6_9FIRM|nr:sugar phosphate nucleotidyltransferase [Thomasclavelia cocleata]MCI9629521.1 NTP transferase domain-containing protein [Thomasclavelia cocleata]MCR1959414.1 sugar phosphate nucleotidyltransferase [Thomasclavelia cocleata]NDO42438.1 nucleotidyltransferase [Thomasclavelia cocleata]PJN81072.1 nucleotidyltransferase [Thomasclavelia cocleata]SET19033.1 UTP-glucose-1-phosphate uridylyltransferase [Thomasclavelia cocleata]